LRCTNNRVAAARALAQAVSCRLLAADTVFDPRPVSMGFVSHEVALGQVSVSVFQRSPPVSFHQCSLLIHSSVIDTILT
jgi:hypothetical protein